MTTTDRTRVPLSTRNSLRVSTSVFAPLFFVAQACLLVNTALSSPADEVSKAVSELDELRTPNNPTLFVDAERRVGDLLAKFTDPKDQGQICFELLHIYGQSAGPPQRIMECAKKAIQFPLEPQQKIRLYLYWGDALLHPDPHSPSANRQSAAVVYLDGINEYRRIRAEQAQLAVKDKLDATSDAQMTQYYEALVGQTQVAYLSRPFAPADELRDLVANKTGDSELANRMVKAVEEARAKMRVLKHPPNGGSHAGALNPPPRRMSAVPLLAGMLVILSAVLIGRRWHVRHRTAAP